MLTSTWHAKKALHKHCIEAGLVWDKSLPVDKERLFPHLILWIYKQLSTPLRKNHGFHAGGRAVRAPGKLFSMLSCLHLGLLQTVWRSMSASSLTFFFYRFLPVFRKNARVCGFFVGLQ